MKKFILFSISCIFLIHSVQAQYDAQFSQNMNIGQVHNPAMISIDGKAKVLGLNRQQWVGLDNAPSTLIFDVSIPFKIGDTKHAGGIMFSNDNVGLFSNQSVHFQYAYRRNLFNGTLGVGTHFGFLNNTFDGSKVFIPESEAHETSDPSVPGSSQNGMAFDLSLGASYYDESKYAGISLAHITNPTIEIVDKTQMAEIKVRPLLNVMGGYNFKLGESLYVLKPSVFFKTDFATMQIDLNAMIEYKKLFSGGISYRLQDAVVLLLGLKLTNGMEVGFSYDITTSKLAKVSYGSFEIMVGYSFEFDKSKKHKYKSIRIL